MVVNTWDGAANTNWDDAGNWNSTGITDRIPTDADDVIIPDTSSLNNPTLRQNQPVQSLVMQTNATVVGAGFKITVHGESSNVAVDHDGIISGDLDLEIQTASATTLDITQASANFRDVIINDASCVATLVTNTTIGRNLTITAGELNTTGTDASLTVTGNVIVGDGSGSANTAILDGNASAISVGSLTIDSDGKYIATSGTTTLTSENSSGYCWWQSGGTLTHSNGTVKYTGSADTVMRGQGFYNLILEGSSSSVDLYVRPHDNVADGDGVFTIANDLTIVEGVLRRNYQPNQLVVTGDVSVESGGTLGTTDATGPNTFGSLTIASGGTYSATSGTTTITNETGGYAWTNNETDGTGFVHNNGLVHLDIGSSGGSTNVKENTFYNLKVDMHLATYSCSLQDITGNAITILNDLDITKGEAEMMTASDSLTVHGLTNITADGKFNDNGTATGTITHHGLVTNLGTYKIKSGETYNLNGGIRQLGTLTVA